MAAKTQLQTADQGSENIVQAAFGGNKVLQLASKVHGDIFSILKLQKRKCDIVFTKDSIQFAKLV